MADILVDEEPRRFVDELDAGWFVNEWLEGLATKVRSHPDFANYPYYDVEYCRHEQSDGKTVLVWWRRELVGVAVCVRDLVNFSVLVVREVDWSSGRN